MLPRHHVTSGWFAKQKKTHTRWSAVNQPPLTLLLANDNMVLHHSCLAPGPWSGSTGEMISSRAEVCGVNPLSRVKLVGK